MHSSLLSVWNMTKSKPNPSCESVQATIQNCKSFLAASAKDGSKQNKKTSKEASVKHPKPLPTPESKLHITGKFLLNSLYDELH